MINIFVTYRCNLRCPYCFAADQKSRFRADMSMADFHSLLDWMTGAGVMMAGFIGGEPTLCADLPEMIRLTRARGIAVTLFTNGLFSSGLVSMLTPHVDNFVVNYNDPAVFGSDTARSLLHHNLNLLSRAGSRITFSKNFSPRYSTYAYLLQGAARFGVKHVRYDISRPSGGGGNDHFSGENTRAFMETILSFVRDCGNLGIKTGLDCCVKLCDLAPEDFSYLTRVSMKFTGICHPSIDIHPDLSASYCQPLPDVTVPDVTRFPSCERLLQHFAEAVRDLRDQPASPACRSCGHFKKRCQGGCLATKIRESSGQTSPEKSLQPEREKIHG